MKQLVKQSKKNIFKLGNIIPILLLCVLIIIILNPTKYSSVALTGLEVWVKVLVPSLFPFFVLTKLFSASGFIDDFTKLFAPTSKKLYKCPPVSTYIFLMSIITGYPVGAKLVADFYNSGNLSKTDAIKTLSFSANSGPMFILGSVAIGMFKSKKLGLIIYISHILGALINGLVYRNYGNFILKKHKNNTSKNKTDLTQKQMQIPNSAQMHTLAQKNSINFVESINSSISSIMLIGGVICFTFVLIEVITSSAIFKGIINAISGIGINSNLLSALFSGIFEITKGCLMISSIPLSFNLVTMLCTFIISFGGISTLLQAIAFTKNIVPTKIFILQKISHALCATLVCALILIFV